MIKEIISDFDPNHELTSLEKSQNMAVSLNQNFGILNGPGALVTTPKLCQRPFLNVFLPYTKTEEISNVDTKSWANPVRKSQNVAGGVNGNFGILHGPDALVTTPKHCQTHIEVEEISNFDSKSWANPLALQSNRVKRSRR